jgi:hypothetical protein
MPFAVTHSSGMTKDAEFEAYARLLRKRGVDLSQTPRVPDSEGRRWLAVWPDRSSAEQFAKDLGRNTRQEWKVLETNGTPSVGPLIPVQIVVSRRSDQWLFELHELSRAMLESLGLAPPARTRVSIQVTTRQDFLSQFGTLDDLCRGVAPALTNLSLDQLDDFGYVLVDAESGEELTMASPMSLRPTPA